MIIIYDKQTKEVLYNGDKPLNYEDNKPVYKKTYVEVEKEISVPVRETDEEGNEILTSKTETVKVFEPQEELVGYTMYYNPEVFDTAEVPDNFRENFYKNT